MRWYLSIIVALIFSFASVSDSFGQDCDTCLVNVPKAITPNCDGVDCEYLTIESNCEIHQFRLQVFNRWGAVIFESKSVSDRFNAKDAKDGTYMWKVYAVFCGGYERRVDGALMVIK